MSIQPGSDNFELADYIGVLRRRWLMIVAITFIGIAVAGAYYYVTPRVYAATTLVQVNALQNNANALGGRTSGAVNMDNEGQIVQSAMVASIVKSKMNSPLSVTGLLKDVKVAVPANTTFLRITCDTRTADLAQRCANAFGRAYLYNRRATALNLITSTIKQLESQATTLESTIEHLRSSAARGVAQLQLTAMVARLSKIQGKISSAMPLEANLTAKNTAVGQIVTPAVKPFAPTSPKKKLVLPSGMAAGLVLGLVFAFGADWRRRIYSARDVRRKVDLPTVFSLVDRADRVRSVLAPPRSRAGQVFTSLAQYAGSALGDGHHVMLVTSTTAGSDGAVATNLAAALARTRGETVLIHADPRGSAMPRLLDGGDERGFAELLAGSVTVGEVLRRTAEAPQLLVITPGLDDGGVAYNMQHDNVRRIMGEIRGEARYVVIDVPPPAADADLFCLAEFADAAILAIPVRSTQPADVTDCVERLERMHIALLGAVMVPPGSRPVSADKPAPYERSLSTRRSRGRPRRMSSTESAGQA